MKSGKVWGKTETILANGVLEFHRIIIKKGGCCSEHMHSHKFNGFFVQEGHLLIRVWKNDYDLVDETHLFPGDFMQVPPGEYHSFEAIEETVAFELYYALFDHDDITRKTVGHAGTKDEDGASCFGPGGTPQ